MLPAAVAGQPILGQLVVPIQTLPGQPSTLQPEHLAEVTVARGRHQKFGFG